MKKMLASLCTLIALSIGIQASQAACPCQAQDPCPCVTKSCEDFLCPQQMEDLFCKIGLNECQKVQARIAVSQFMSDTECLRSTGYKCESKCECRAYRKALKTLDCSMKNIITKCQKADYKCARNEVKDQVKCCHKCLINPFKRCKCACK